MGTNQRASITMTEPEVALFLQQSRTASLATIGPDGVAHLAAMWFGVVGGKVYFETKAKSQKVVNLRRNPNVTCLVEAGHTYDQLRGVAIEGTAALLEDHADPEFTAAMISVYERYFGPYSEDLREGVEAMAHNRVVVRIDPVRLRSWDHRKLGLPPAPLAGSTAEFLGREGEPARG